MPARRHGLPRFALQPGTDIHGIFVGLIVHVIVRGLRTTAFAAPAFAAAAFASVSAPASAAAVSAAAFVAARRAAATIIATAVAAAAAAVAAIRGRPAAVEWTPVGPDIRS